MSEKDLGREGQVLATGSHQQGQEQWVPKAVGGTDVAVMSATEELSEEVTLELTPK